MSRFGVLGGGETCHKLLLATYLRDLVFEPRYQHTGVLETIGKLQNLRTLRLNLLYCELVRVRLNLTTVARDVSEYTLSARKF